MLTQAEIDGCREAFSRFDRDGSGTIDATELRATLEALGQKPTDEELFLMIAQVDEDNSGEIEFPEFLKIPLLRMEILLITTGKDTAEVIENQKKVLAAMGDETDTLDAFIALGGESDKRGQISTEKLRAVIKDFGLTIDIEQLIKETDLDGSGFIDYEEFKTMMT